MILNSRTQPSTSVSFRWVLLIALASILAIGGIANAQYGKGMQGSAGSQKGKNSQWWTNPTVQEMLQLSNEQIVAIGEVIAAHEEHLQEIVTTERAAYRKLIQALDSQSTSAEKIEARRSDLEAAWGERMVANTDKWISLREILSFEQWKTLPEAAPAALRLGHLSVVSRGRIKVKDSTNE